MVNAAETVARIERSEIRDRPVNGAPPPPGFAALNPGYSCIQLATSWSMRRHPAFSSAQLFLRVSSLLAAVFGVVLRRAAALGGCRDSGIRRNIG